MRFRTFIAALTVAVLTMSGCSSELPTRTVAQEDQVPGQTADVQTIRLLSMPGDPGLDALISAFHNKYSNIRVEQVPYVKGAPASLDATGILTAKLKNNEIDVFRVLGAGVHNLATLGLAAELDSYVKRSDINLNPIAGVVDPLRVGGKLYGLPVYSNPQAILYNADMFAAAGVPAPKPGWTWEEFRTAAARLSSGSEASRVWGFATDFGPSTLTLNMIFEQVGNGQPASAELARYVLQYWATLIDMDQSVRPAPNRLADGTFAVPTEPDDFQHGRAAMTLTPLSSFASLDEDLSFRWEIAPIPVARGTTPTLTAVPYSYGMARNSPSADAAWRFIEFAAGEEGAVIFAKAGLMPVLRTEAVKRAWFEQPRVPPPSTAPYLEMDQRTWVLSPDKANQINVALLKSVESVLEGGADWEELYQAFVKDREGILGGG